MRLRHWSARALRSTRTRVEVPRSAITAQAMTVLPEPGGATSTPSSWASSALTAVALPGGEFGGERDVDLAAGVSRVGDGQPRSGPLDDAGDGVAQPARQDQAVVEGEVVAADEPRGVPGGLAQPLQFVELRVGHGGGVLERRQRGRGELRGVDAQPGAEFRVHHRRQRRLDPGGVGPAHRGDVGADGGPFRPAGDPFRVAGAEPVQRRQERPLVLVRLQRARSRNVVSPSLRRRPCSGAAIRLPKPPSGRTSWFGNSRSYERRSIEPRSTIASCSSAVPTAARRRRRDRVGEEDPHVRAASGLGDLQRRRDRAGPGRLDVGQRVEHRRRAVEVRHQEPARVVRAAAGTAR